MEINNNTSEYAPIVLFVYNRFEHTKKTIEALQKNELARDSILYIYSDEAKNYNSRKSVDDIRNYIQGINGFKKVIVIERDKNFGLTDSIVDGVSKVVNEYGKVIVLEDDLVTSKYFLRFMNDGLKFYEKEASVWEIGGYVYPVKLEKDKTFLAHYTTSWGWATWSDRWQYFERNPKKLINSFSKNDKYKFNLDNSDNIWYQVELNDLGKLYTWAVFWYANIFQHKGLTLYPYKSLVQNIGHDGSGENCRSSDKFRTQLQDYKIHIKTIPMVINLEYYEIIKKYLKQNKDNYVIFFLKKIYRILFK